MTSHHMPPVPPANRSPKGPGDDPKIEQDTSMHPPKAVKSSVFLISSSGLEAVCGLTPGRCNHIATKWRPAVSLLSEVERLRA